MGQRRRAEPQVDVRGRINALIARAVDGTTPLLDIPTVNQLLRAGTNVEFAAEVVQAATEVLWHSTANANATLKVLKILIVGLLQRPESFMVACKAFAPEIETIRLLSFSRDEPLRMVIHQTARALYLFLMGRGQFPDVGPLSLPEMPGARRRQPAAGPAPAPAKAPLEQPRVPVALGGAPVGRDDGMSLLGFDDDGPAVRAPVAAGGSSPAAEDSSDLPPINSARVILPGEPDYDAPPRRTGLDEFGRLDDDGPVGGDLFGADWADLDDGRPALADPFKERRASASGGGGGSLLDDLGLIGEGPQTTSQPSAPTFEADGAGAIQGAGSAGALGLAVARQAHGAGKGGDESLDSDLPPVAQDEGTFDPFGSGGATFDPFGTGGGLPGAVAPSQPRGEAGRAGAGGRGTKSAGSVARAAVPVAVSEGDSWDPFADAVAGASSASLVAGAASPNPLPDAPAPAGRPSRGAGGSLLGDFDDDFLLSGGAGGAALGDGSAKAAVREPGEPVGRDGSGGVKLPELGGVRVARSWEKAAPAEAFDPFGGAAPAVPAKAAAASAGSPKVAAGGGFDPFGGVAPAVAAKAAANEFDLFGDAAPAAPAKAGAVEFDPFADVAPSVPARAAVTPTVPVKAAAGGFDPFADVAPSVPARATVTPTPPAKAATARAAPAKAAPAAPAADEFDPFGGAVAVLPARAAAPAQGAQAAGGAGWPGELSGGQDGDDWDPFGEAATPVFAPAPAGAARGQVAPKSSADDLLGGLSGAGQGKAAEVVPPPVAGAFDPFQQLGGGGQAAPPGAGIGEFDLFGSAGSGPAPRAGGGAAGLGELPVAAAPVVASAPAQPAPSAPLADSPRKVSSGGAQGSRRSAAKSPAPAPSSSGDDTYDPFAEWGAAAPGPAPAAKGSPAKRHGLFK